MMAAVRQAEPAGRRIGREECVVILAGGGMLPVELARHLREQGQRTVIFRLEGEALPTALFPDFPCEIFRLEDFPDLLQHLRRHEAKYAVMAGWVERRPRLAALRWNFNLLRMLPGLARALLRGDDGLLRHVVGHVEAGGIEIVGAHELLPDVLVEAGCLTECRPGRADWQDVRAALAAASAIGALDIGQAAIAIGGRAIALEGVEGTDGLLERTIDLRRHGRLAGATGGVLGKCAKPQQELRADLPAIGPRTVRDAARAGLAGIALEAGRTLILDRGETLRLAREHDLFIVGVDPAGELP